MPNLKSNKREIQVYNKAVLEGWEVLTKGYPDFLLYKEKENKVLFIEVKRKCKNTVKKGLSSHQSRMISILKRIGLQVEIIYI
jgi:hypothetical protein